MTVKELLKGNLSILDLIGIVKSIDPEIDDKKAYMIAESYMEGKWWYFEKTKQWVKIIPNQENLEIWNTQK